MMKEENDPIQQFDLFKRIIKDQALIHQRLLKYLGISDDELNPNPMKDEELKEFYQLLKEKLIITKKLKFKDLLNTVSHLWKMHETKKEVKDKIKNLIIILKKDIKNLLSEKEILNIFFANCEEFFLLFLVEQNILSIATIIDNINLRSICYQQLIMFFYPEIQKYNKKILDELMFMVNSCELKQFVEENNQNLELFYEKRKECEKETKIIELIREDNIKEFISYVEYFSLDLNKKIREERNIFEINFSHKMYFEKFTPIEYSALFGSIAIFKYLYMKEVNINLNVEFNKNIIELAIIGRNYEIIHLLEEKKEIFEELNNQKKQPKYLKSSIEMHHNEISDYLIVEYNIQITKEIIGSIIYCRNYQLFDQLIERNQIKLKNAGIIINMLNHFSRNENDEIVKILINQPNLDANSKDKIFQQSFEKIDKKITESI